MAVESLAPAPTPEAGTNQELLRIGPAIDTLANNPLRPLLYLALTEAPEPLTPSEQANRLNELQEGQPGWELDKNDCSTVGSACKNVLVPGQLVVPVIKTNKRGKDVTAYAAGSDQERYKAVAGTLLDWELQFPGQSLALALGDTKPGVDEGMPQTTLRLYQHLFDEPNGFSSLFRLLRAVGRPRRTVERIVGLLEERGILEKNMKPPFAGRSLVIRPPRGGHLEIQGGKMRDIMIAVFRSCMQVLLAGEDRVSVRQLATMTAAQNPAFSLEALYEGFGVALPSYLTYDDRADFNGSDPLAKTRIAVTKNTRGAIADLVLRVRRLESDKKFREEAARRAYGILHSPPDVAALLAKSRERMAPTARQSRDEQNRRRLGSLSLIELHTRRHWRQGAACGVGDTEFFFPEDPAAYGAYGAKAKALCEGCPVQISCLQWALDHRPQHGIFGGMTAEERRKYLRKPGVPENNPSRGQAVIANRQLAAFARAATHQAAARQRG